MVRKKKSDPEFNPSPRMRAFLAAIRITPQLTVAAKVAGIGRSAHYRELERNPLYRVAFDAAYQEGVDGLEAEAIRRAQYGFRKLVVYHGSPVLVPRDPARPPHKKRNPLVPLYETEYSDQLLLALLRAKKPSEYKDRVEHELGDKTAKRFDGTMEELLGLFHMLTKPEGDDDK